MTRHPIPGENELLALKDKFKALDPEEKKLLREDLRFVLQRRIEGIHYAEIRRNGIATLATGVFAAGIALIATTTNVQQATPSLGTALTFLSVGFLITGVTTWVIFVRQINIKYPFQDATKNSKWFYHGALPAKDTLKVFSTLAGTFKRNDEVEKLTQEFNRHVGAFYESAEGWLINGENSLEADVKQLHSLHANECIKNNQLTLIRKHFHRMLAASVVIALIVLVVSIMNINDRSNMLSSTGQTRPSTLSGERLRLYEYAGKPGGSRTFTVESPSGNPLPFVINGYLDQKSPLQIWVPESEADKYDHLRIRFK